MWSILVHVQGRLWIILSHLWQVQLFQEGAWVDYHFALVLPVKTFPTVGYFWHLKPVIRQLHQLNERRPTTFLFRSPILWFRLNRNNTIKKRRSGNKIKHYLQARPQQHDLRSDLKKMTTHSNKSINLTVLKVESMKIHPFYQVAQRFRLKRSQTRVADLAEEERAGRVNETKHYLETMHLNPSHTLKDRLTRMPQSLHCWLPRSAAQWSWWSLVCVLQRMAGTEVNQR